MGGDDRSWILGDDVASGDEGTFSTSGLDDVGVEGGLGQQNIQEELKQGEKILSDVLQKSKIRFGHQNMFFFISCLSETHCFLCKG